MGEVPSAWSAISGITLTGWASILYLAWGGTLLGNGIFSKLTQYDYEGWAELEWECCIKHPEQGAAEGAQFIQRHIIRVAEHAFDDFASSGADAAANRRMLGLQ